MKRITAFLAVLILLFSVTAYAEEGDASSLPEETPVETLLRNSLSSVERGSVLLIGGNASALWRDYSFDMYPHTVASLTLADTGLADWAGCVSYLKMYSPAAVIYCLDGREQADIAAVFVQTAATALNSVRIYFVSALQGDNLQGVNQAVMTACESYPNAEFVDVYSLMLTEEGTENLEYISGTVTPAGLRLLGKTVFNAVTFDIPVFSPEVSSPVRDTSEEVEAQPAKRSYRWLVPIAILAVGLMIGAERAYAVTKEEKRRKARGK